MINPTFLIYDSKAWRRGENIIECEYKLSFKNKVDSRKLQIINIYKFFVAKFYDTMHFWLPKMHKIVLSNEPSKILDYLQELNYEI